MDHNFSVYLSFGTNFENNVLPASEKITTIHFILHVGSAEFQTSKSEARQ